MVHKFTREESDFLRANVKGRSNVELTELFNKQFDLDLKTTQIRAFKKNRKLSSGLTGQYEKGNIPFNKGMKGVNFGGRETQFKTGQQPHNYLPVGTERINGEGYVDIKVSDTGKYKWKAKHRIIWEEANGPIPDGYRLIFGDGNKLNVQLDNLLLITQRQLTYLNRNHLIQSDVELTKTGIIIADVLSKIYERKNAMKK